jgi:hypothetical protein
LTNSLHSQLTYNGQISTCPMRLAEVVLIAYFDFSSWILLWTVAAIIAAVQIDRLLEPLRTQVPPLTLREFTNGVLSLNFRELSKKNGVSRREMELVMNEIIINKLGVDPVEVVPEARLADDLGLD